MLNLKSNILNKRSMAALDVVNAVRGLFVNLGELGWMGTGMIDSTQKKIVSRALRMFNRCVFLDKVDKFSCIAIGGHVF